MTTNAPLPNSRLFFALFALGAGLAASACAEPDPEFAGQSRDEVRSAHAVTLSWLAGGGLDLDDRPRFKSRARGSMVCGELFESEGRRRLVCTRGQERAELLLSADGQSAVVRHREGRALANLTCVVRGQDEDGQPRDLACRPAEPRPSAGRRGLVSPFPSTAAGIDIPNAHEVGPPGVWIRAMAPSLPSDFDQLEQAGVSRVLIFKHQSSRSHEVDDEKAELARRGFTGSKVLHVPFHWKDLPNFQQPCEQTLTALKFLLENRAAGQKTFFHCTVGEDRTGYLSALLLRLLDPTLAVEDAFDDEMCEKGFSSGNPQKPAFVTGALGRSLAPLYRKMALLIATGQLSEAQLDPAVCLTDPSSDPTFEAQAVPAARLTCGTSTRYVP